MSDETKTMRVMIGENAYRLDVSENWFKYFDTNPDGSDNAVAEFLWSNTAQAFTIQYVSEWHPIGTIAAITRHIEVAVDALAWKPLSDSELSELRKANTPPDVGPMFVVGFEHSRHILVEAMAGHGSHFRSEPIAVSSGFGMNWECADAIAAKRKRDDGTKPGRVFYLVDHSIRQKMLMFTWRYTGHDSDCRNIGAAADTCDCGYLAALNELGSMLRL